MRFLFTAEALRWNFRLIEISHHCVIKLVPFFLLIGFEALLFLNVAVVVT
jgi:hypothetical protein